MSEAMHEYVPKWHQELDVFSRIKSGLILEGNIFDTYTYPSGTYAGAWLNLPSYLHTYFKELGYTHVIQYNHIDGFTSLEIDPKEQRERLKAFASCTKTTVQNTHIASRFTPDPGGAPYVIRDALLQSNESTVIILDFASRYILSPDRMNPAELMNFSILQQGILHAAEVVVEGRAMRNMAVFIVNKKNDLPAWMYLDMPTVKGICLDTPSSQERLQFIGGYDMKGFFDRQIYTEDMQAFVSKGKELHRLVDRFVARTEGFTYNEMEQLRMLCRSRKIHIKDLCSVIDLYTYGVVENPWQAASLRERLELGQEIIMRRVKGQDDAATQSLDILKRAVSGLSRVRNSASPKGVLFFAGPTGTGKTEMAKTLAELVFGDESACIRFDMSEYMQENSDQRLLGAPPGYVGYEAGGQLTNAVRKNPFSILLFDEIEKASPTIMDKFLQILEDGRMTDGQGNTVYFSDCVIIFTSNLGIYTTDEYGRRHVNVTPDMNREDVRSHVIQAIGDHFKLKLGRPEILNRIGENIVIFDYITPEAAQAILKQRLQGIHSSILNESGIDVCFEPIEELLLQKVLTNLENGGRGINNMIEKYLINPLARHIFDGKIPRGTAWKVTNLHMEKTPVDLEWRET